MSSAQPQYVTAGINSVAQVQPIHTIGSSAQPLQYMVAPSEAYGGDKVTNFLPILKRISAYSLDALDPRFSIFMRRDVIFLGSNHVAEYTKHDVSPICLLQLPITLCICSGHFKAPLKLCRTLECYFHTSFACI